MPDSYTPHLQLVKAEIGASRDTWGAKLNANMDTLDTYVAASMPVGAVMDFAGPQPPAGWLVCDGRLLSRTAYAALFAVLGTYWGSGDGSTTFALPNTAGRASIGPGRVIDDASLSYDFSFTQTIGNVTNWITQAALPNYWLYVGTAGVHNHGLYTTAAGAHGHTTDAQGQHSHSGATNSESAQHVHSGVVDQNGYHDHQAPVPGIDYTPGGGYPINAGGIQFDGHRTDGGGTHGHTFTTGAESTPHIHAIYPDGNHAHNRLWGRRPHPCDLLGWRSHPSGGAERRRAGACSR